MKTHADLNTEEWMALHAAQDCLREGVAPTGAALAARRDGLTPAAAARARRRLESWGLLPAAPRRPAPTPAEVEAARAEVQNARFRNVGVAKSDPCAKLAYITAGDNAAACRVILATFRETFGAPR